MFLIYLVVLHNALYRALESVSLIIHLFRLLLQSRFQNFHLFCLPWKLKSQVKEKKKKNKQKVFLQLTTTIVSLISTSSISLNAEYSKILPFYLLLCQFFRLFFYYVYNRKFFSFFALALFDNLPSEWTSDNFLRRSFPFSMN